MYKMASSSSSRPSLSPSASRLHPQFTPECEREENEDEFEEGGGVGGTPSGCVDKQEVDTKHLATPLHQKRSARRRPESGGDHGSGGDDRGVSCNKCRPSNREKISVVPLDNNGLGRHSIPSPNGILKSIMHSLTKKSPRTPSDAAAGREEQWKIAAAELSHKLIQATRKRDEAVLEASRLKYSMAELEKKLTKLEVYCQDLKSGLEVCASKKSPNRPLAINTNHNQSITVGDHDKVVEHFLVAVSESRSTVRFLSRSLTLQLRQMGVKVFDKISLLLQPYDVKISVSKNPRALVFYFESLLNKAFFEDFESIGFQKSAPTQILNPIDRCSANFASFTHLQGVTWEEVLNKGTRHFSEDFSKFCDRKMNEIVAMLGWNRAWPEPLLQAFFGASKSVWLAHLLANSVHPGLPVFRVDKGARFDPVYMEDMGGDRDRKLVPAVVRIMVTPGFYILGNVVKCKVLCRYRGKNGYGETGLTLSPGS
ncbi:IRK-interacting protein isoform X2 [Diospyros lotus]|uniref:IRK-interacting protein isoform X2 n=1 Tax=Diospyros lotus TaxID=55363 RepID=UPI0022556C1E|nr:IRK-interacting protein isoform X2 [Diospyros lotus]